MALYRPTAEQVEMADGTYTNPFIQGLSYGVYGYGAEPYTRRHFSSVWNHTPSSAIGHISLYSEEELVKHAYQ